MGLVAGDSVVLNDPTSGAYNSAGAGAATTVITPALGVSLAGSMLDRRAETVHDDLCARCLVLDNGEAELLEIGGTGGAAGVLADFLKDR